MSFSLYLSLIAITFCLSFHQVVCLGPFFNAQLPNFVYTGRYHQAELAGQAAIQYDWSGFQIEFRFGAHNFVLIDFTLICSRVFALRRHLRYNHVSR